MKYNLYNFKLIIIGDTAYLYHNGIKLLILHDPNFGFLDTFSHSKFYMSDYSYCKSVLPSYNWDFLGNIWQEWGNINRVPVTDLGPILPERMPWDIINNALQGKSALHTIGFSNVDAVLSRIIEATEIGAIPLDLELVYLSKFILNYPACIPLLFPVLVSMLYRSDYIVPGLLNFLSLSFNNVNGRFNEFISYLKRNYFDLISRNNELFQVYVDRTVNYTRGLSNRNNSLLQGFARRGGNIAIDFTLRTLIPTPQGLIRPTGSIVPHTYSLHNRNLLRRLSDRILTLRRSIRQYRSNVGNRFQNIRSFNWITRSEFRFPGFSYLRNRLHNPDWLNHIVNTLQSLYDRLRTYITDIRLGARAREWEGIHDQSQLDNINTILDRIYLMLAGLYNIVGLTIATLRQLLNF